MLAFGRTGRDEQAIFDTGLERLRVFARHFGFHAANFLAVSERLTDRHGVGVGDQMPEWHTIFIGLPFVQRDDFEFREFVGSSQFENDRNGERIVLRFGAVGAGVDAGNVNDLWLEPVGEIKSVDGGQRERDGNENAVSFGHKIFECGAVGFVKSIVQTRARNEWL
jgi:hypothetical protein